jgi:AraC-like DNA-binding protein
MSPQRADGTMPVLVVRALAVGAATLGVPIPTERFPLANPDARVPASEVRALWGLLSRERADFGLWLAELTRDAPFTVASYVIQSSGTLGEGLARAVRYQRLVHDQSRGLVLHGDRETTYRHRIGHYRGPNAALEFGFASIIHLARRATGEQITPTRVWFQHAEPNDLARYKAFFGPGLRFGQAHDELAFDVADRARPLKSADPALREMIEAHARLLLERLPPEQATTAQRTRVALSEMLRGGAPTLRSVAEKLGMPARTLQRRLQEEDTRFDALLDEVRRELATRYIRDVRISIQETAFLVGFSDVAAFHRAFVRWTGQTPARFRGAQ